MPTFNTTRNVLRIRVRGMDLKYSPKSDKRILAVEANRLVTWTTEDAKGIAAEMRAWGISKAKAIGKTVEFV